MLSRLSPAAYGYQPAPDLLRYSSLPVEINVSVTVFQVNQRRAFNVTRGPSDLSSDNPCHSSTSSASSNLFQELPQSPGFFLDALLTRLDFMDRFKKHIPDAVRDRIDPPKSYVGYSDSRTSIRRASTEPRSMLTLTSDRPTSVRRPRTRGTNSPPNLTAERPIQLRASAQAQGCLWRRNRRCLHQPHQISGFTIVGSASTAPQRPPQ